MLPIPPERVWFIEVMIRQVIFCGKEIYTEYPPSSSALYHQAHCDVAVRTVEQSGIHLAGVRRAPWLCYIWRLGPCLTAAVVKPSARKTGSTSIRLSGSSRGPCTEVICSGGRSIPWGAVQVLHLPVPTKAKRARSETEITNEQKALRPTHAMAWNVISASRRNMLKSELHLPEKRGGKREKGRENNTLFLVGLTLICGRMTAPPCTCQPLALATGLLWPTKARAS